jgi:hypothetical protein
MLVSPTLNTMLYQFIAVQILTTWDLFKKNIDNVS